MCGGGGGWVAYSILVSAQGPLVLGFGTKAFGAKGLGSGLDNKLGIEKKSILTQCRVIALMLESSL